MHKYSEADTKDMLGFLFDNILVVSGNKIFQQAVGILMGTKGLLYIRSVFESGRLLRS
jgi:hypothetical protein